MLPRQGNFSISNAARISVGLLLIVLSAMGVSYTLGLLPSSDKQRTQRRLELAKSLAIQFSTAIEEKNARNIEDLAGSVIGSLPDIASIGLRRADGKLIFASTAHDVQWRNACADPKQSRSQPVHVALLEHDKPWGQVELIFRVEQASFRTGLIGLILFVGLSCLLGFLLFMKRTLRVLDPSTVVPERVRSMLDTLAEGAAVVDADGRIVLANQSLARILNTAADKLLGVSLDQIPWRTPRAQSQSPDTAPAQPDLPWSHLKGDLSCRGRMVQLQTDAGLRSLAVNASTIAGGRAGARGWLFTFDDVTAVEQKNQQLVEMVDQLGQAQQRVQKQNEELRRLATRDPLTDCLNRRTFHEQVETLFSLASRQQISLSVIMVDIDHFKAVNDNHGHARGDEVLRGVAKTLAANVRASDVLCRYGGEEFCILLPATDLNGAHALAQKLCSAMAAAPISGLSVTASLGVSCSTLGAATGPLLIDQADQALYNSKHAGRNRATRFDQLDPSVPPKSAEPGKPEQAAEQQIPMHAVRSLLAALSFRDPQTAEHSRRVSELCVKAGAAWLDSRELFILETAALLHDIGKVGVPDAILLKPGPLTDDEWRVMRQHDRIGLEIIQTAFNCPQLAGIIACHHSRHESSPGAAPLPAPAEIIPMGARLLAIADAYDAMTTHRVYRRARSQDAAFVELRRYAGSQFDPLLVEHFIAAMSASPSSASADRHAEKLASILRLSMEAEQTAAAILNNDLHATVALATHLAQIATSMGSTQVADRCRRIIASVESTADAPTLIAEARALLSAVTSPASARSAA